MAIGNRTASPITVFASGGVLGDIGAGQTVTFVLGTLRPSGEITATEVGNLISPTPIVNVTFTARELKTGTLSPGQTVTLTQHYVTYLAFEPLCLATTSTGSVDTSKRWACPQ